MEGLEGEETEFYAAKLQAVARKFIVRSKIMKEVTDRYEKIFDPKRKKYYYYDKKLDSSSWLKPVMLLDKDIEDVAPTYLPDQAAVKLQRAIRRFLALLKVRLTFQECVMRVKDEKSNEDYFVNSKTGAKFQHLPSFMNGRLDYRRKEPAEFGPNGSDEDSDEDSDAESLDTEARLEKRRKRRKYPRSKAQSLVDYVEDNMTSTFILDMSHLNAKHITSRIYDFTQLTNLNLSHNRLSKVSADLQYIGALKILDISHNRIQTLPSELKELSNLHTLKASHNRIDTFSGQVYRIETMTYLDLSHNLLTDLPVETGNLELLTELGLFEVGISQMASLSFLSLANNKLQTFPSQVSSLTKLRTLLLGHNCIPSMPEDEISQMSSLQILDIQHNSLANLPASLFLLPLKELFANNNVIENFPALPVADDSSITLPTPLPLTSLSVLDLSFNRIESVAAHMNLLTNLKHVTFAHNKLSFIDDNAFANLSSLVSLTLSYNSLAVLPSSLSSCHSLEKMFIESNQLSDLPLGMMRCGRITHLIAHHNKFMSLNGKVLTMFMNMEEIDFRDNSLSTFPALLFSVRKVKYAYFSHNKIVDVLGQISEWSDLIKLDLSYNQLTTIPASLCSCARVEELYLHYNSLYTLPKELSNMTELRILTLHHNQLTASPTLAAQVGKLKHVNLSFNPLIQSPFAVWQFYHAEEEKSKRVVSKAKRNSRYHLYKRIASIEERVECYMQKSIHGAIASQSREGYALPVDGILRRLYDDLNPTRAHQQKTFIELKQAFLHLQEGLSTYIAKKADDNKGRTPPMSSPTMEDLCGCLLRFMQLWYVLQEERRFLSIQHKIRLNLTPLSAHHPARYPSPFLPSSVEVQGLAKKVKDEVGGDEKLNDLLVILFRRHNQEELWRELTDTFSVCVDMNRHTCLLHILTLLSPLSLHNSVQTYDALCGSSAPMLKEGVRGVWDKQGAPVADKQVNVETKNKAENTKNENKQSMGGGILGSFFKKKVTATKETPNPTPVATANQAESKDPDDDLGEGVGHMREGQEMMDKVITLLSPSNSPVPISLPLHLLLSPPSQLSSTQNATPSSLLPSPLPPILLPSPLLSIPLPPSLPMDYEDGTGGGVGFPPLVIKVYVCMLKLLLTISDSLADGVRIIERYVAETNVKANGTYVSKLDVAQRGYLHTSAASGKSPDLFDLLSDLWTLLGGDVEGSGKEKQLGEKKIKEKVKKYKLEFDEIFKTLLPPDPDQEDQENLDKDRDNKTETEVTSAPPSPAPTPSAIKSDATSSFNDFPISPVSMEDEDNSNAALASVLESLPMVALFSLVDFLLLLRQLLLLYACHIGTVVMELLGGMGEGIGGEGGLDAVLAPAQAPLDIGLPLPSPQPALSFLAPAVARMVRRWGGRVYTYMGSVCKGLGLYPLAASYYRKHIQLLNKLGDRRVSKEVYVSLLKVLLAQGQFFQARSLCESIATLYLLPPDFSTSSNQHGNTSSIPTPAQLLPVDTEVALLFKYATVQCEELTKVGVFSHTQRRLYNVQTNGFLCSQSSSILPEITSIQEGGVGRGVKYGEAVAKRHVAEDKLKDARKKDSDRQAILEQSRAIREEALRMLDKAASINIK